MDQHRAKIVHIAAFFRGHDVQRLCVIVDDNAVDLTRFRGRFAKDPCETGNIRACYDQFDGKETPQETSVTSICVFPDADESYISHVDAGSVVDGYVGCGEAPLCLSGIKTEG